MKLFALAAAALLILVGFSMVVTGPSEATGPAVAETESDAESVFGGNGHAAMEVFGGEFPGYPPDLLILLEFTVAADSVTLTATIAMDSPGGIVLGEITAKAKYYAYDALGTARVVLDSGGSRIATLAYQPFGLCSYGCPSEPAYAYTGEYREHDLLGWEVPDLIYLHSRWYDPTIGRFLSPDDRLGALLLPQDQNRYVYFVNNPMKYTDPTGHIAPLLGLAIVGVATALGMSFAILYTAQWLARSATGAEQVGFLTGLALAFLVGLALSTVCAGTAMTGCVAAVLLVSSILGSIIAAATYVAVTVWLGGHPTTEGFAHALYWGGFAGGAGASAGGAIRALAARGANAVKAHVDVKKFSDYVFKPGASHGKDAVFRSYGYGRAHSQMLAKEFARQGAAKYAAGEFALGKLDQFGQRITIDIQLRGIGAATGRATSIRTGWMIESEGSIRLVTPFAGFSG